ncbi:oxidoreductase [Rhodococcus sp. ABRD24]|uniref:PDR/VanB family oxidoreductase n=1 Tax=Rhodococcus sp. ABRD24 TaxID=2507582 RepID=UPI00103AE97C|nr:PDR/VanB family oxidoreductase [Rhodococcus sp. ABRD24]QBJ95898.1 oxidoreductase [Rhodococcus sp. ABRD24]
MKKADLSVIVERKKVVSDGVVSLWLSDPDGRPLPSWQPGAHIDLVRDDGLRRQYSLCGEPTAKQWRLGVLRNDAPDGVSTWVHDVLQAGTQVTVSPPRNLFAFTPSPGSPGSIIFIAGGIGITPLLPMIATCRDRGLDWTLWYGGRTRESMAFLEELPKSQRVHIYPLDECGPLPLDTIVGEYAGGQRIYCCGPSSLIDAVRSHGKSWPDDTVRFERFTKANTSADETASNSAGTFEVECARSGRTIRVDANESIITALSRSGIEVESSCQQGFCGSCETGVLAGLPDHRDDVLSPDDREENSSMIVCVSRSLTDRLVLDL